jgi:hypothetical protein
MGFSLRIAALALALVCFVSTAAKAEDVANPEYKSWAKHKPGTAVSLKQTIKTQGMTVTMDQHQELKSVADDKVVVTAWATMNMGGVTRDTEKRDRTVSSKIAKEKQDMPADMNGKAEPAGNEKVTAAGKEYDCQVVKFSGGDERAKGDGKIWSSAEVPGRIVKMEMKMSGQQEGEMKSELSSVTIK